MTAILRLGRAGWGLDSPRADEWRPKAACRTMDPDLFELKMGGVSTDNMAALAACSRCPVRTQCRNEWAEQPPHRRRGFIAGGIVWRGRKDPRTLRASDAS